MNKLDNSNLKLAVQKQGRLADDSMDFLRRAGFEAKNIFGVQFHPEKSEENGLQLLKNFANIAYENNTGN